MERIAERQKLKISKDYFVIFVFCHSGRRQSVR